MIPKKLIATNVSKKFKQGNSIIEVLQNITITFSQGTSAAITGASGSGKSTLLHILAGLDKPTSGLVQLDSLCINNCSKKQKNIFLNQTIGLLFQRPYLIAELTVFENIIMPALIRGNAHTVQEFAIYLLHKMGLADKSKSKPGSLSGGQQQRVALARALINKPIFLLADEPTGSLDAQAAHHILALLIECQKEWNMGIMVSTHDQTISSMMQEQYYLEQGSLTKIN